MKQDGADEDYLQNRWLPITDEGIVGYNLCK